ncbi:hydrogenase/urease accessory protein [Leptolyngbyaceae cyanobacterium JSC-12]|nr:hydrogenase/urease accessory protein [Leptolyngbyaceae cyanobacterium JSC-12]
MLKSSSLQLRVGLAGLAAMLLATPASAHHAMGGQIPANFSEGFLSGLAHPVIGIDHLTFVVAAGLLAVTKRQGIWIPIAFVLAALGGTGLHLMGVDLPASEFLIASSVLGFGILLALPQSPNLAGMIGLGAIAGIFHGYAYGEAIVGAEMTPLVSYLLGFTAIQLGIALLAAKVGRVAANLVDRTPQSLRYAGFTICGLGAAFTVSRLGL